MTPNPVKQLSLLKGDVIVKLTCQVNRARRQRNVAIALAIIFFILYSACVVSFTMGWIKIVVK